MITKQDKNDLINIIKNIDVKKMEIENENTDKQKWFRFGNFNMAQIITEIIKAFPTKEPESGNPSHVERPPFPPPEATAE